MRARELEIEFLHVFRSRVIILFWSTVVEVQVLAVALS